MDSMEVQFRRDDSFKPGSGNAGHSPVPDPHGAHAFAHAVNNASGHGTDGDEHELEAVVTELADGSFKVEITNVKPNTDARDGNRPILVSSGNGNELAAFDRNAVEVPNSFTGGMVVTPEVKSVSITKDTAIKPVRLRESKNLDIIISGSNGETEIEVSFNKTDSEKFIRNALNTNPVLTNSDIVRLAAGKSKNEDKYWLGETFEETYEHIRRNLKRHGESYSVGYEVGHRSCRFQEPAASIVCCINRVGNSATYRNKL